ncbi:MAG: ATP-binding protein [Nitrososphaeria archaeon]
MRILSKSGDEIKIIAMPNEKVDRGEFLLIEDEASGNKILTQIYEVSYLDPTGIDEEILRDEVFSSEKITHIDPNNVSSLLNMIKDARLLKGKIRGSIINNKFTNEIIWLPSRVFSTIKKVSFSEINKYLAKNLKYPIEIGTTSLGEKFYVDASDLDGSLTIITGKKESGKSHLAKLLLSELVKLGAYIFVFDLNNEYNGMMYDKNNNFSDIYNKIVVLEPGNNLVFTLKYIGKRVFTEILTHALDTPAITVREFLKIWDIMNEESDVSIKNLYSKILEYKNNEMVKEALISRYYSIVASRLFANSEYVNFDIKNNISLKPNGAAFIIEMAKISPLARRMLVQIILSKLINLLEENQIPPVFIFAEEAHLYFDQTYWEDAITRMRHFGIYVTFITNQPDSLDPTVYRQADNIFLFNFINEKDLEMISQASTADSETVKNLVRSLPPKKCLVIGRVVNNLPFLVSVKDVNYKTLGITKRFFDIKREIEKAK